jgi:hypothetical protein
VYYHPLILAASYGDILIEGLIEGPLAISSIDGRRESASS